MHRYSPCLKLAAVELAIALAANIVLALILLGTFAVLGMRHAAELEGPEEALKVYNEQFPGASGAAIVSDDRTSALIALHHRAGIGLVHRHGHRWNAREIQPKDLDSVRLVGDDTIRLSLADFGWPRAQIRIRDRAARATWLARLDAMAASNA